MPITYYPETSQSSAGGYGASASYYSTTIQTGTANSIQAMTFNNTDWSNGIILQNSSQIKFMTPGKFNVQFSAQLEQTQSSGVVNIWLRKNGTNVPNSNTRVNITANSPYAVAAWNFFIAEAVGDYVEIIWSSTSSHTILDYEAPTGSGATQHPAVPSVILTVNQIGE